MRLRTKVAALRELQSASGDASQKELIFAGFILDDLFAGRATARLVKSYYE